MENRTEVLIFRNRKDFMSILLPDLPPSGGVFVSTHSAHNLGDPLQVHLFFPQIPEGIVLYGKVAWRRLPTKWKSALKPGIGVALEQRCLANLSYLMDFCNGSVNSRRKAGIRIQTDFPVEIQLSNGTVSGRAENIGRGGVFVATEKMIEPATTVDIALYIREKSIGNGTPVR